MDAIPKDSIFNRLKLAKTKTEVKHLGFITPASGMNAKDRDEVIKELIKKHDQV